MGGNFPPPNTYSAALARGLPSKGEMRRASIHKRYDVGTGERLGKAERTGAGGSASRTGDCGTGGANGRLGKTKRTGTSGTSGTGGTGGSASRTGNYGTSGASETGGTKKAAFGKAA